jgi:hypothetical protein
MLSEVHAIWIINTQMCGNLPEQHLHTLSLSPFLPQNELCSGSKLQNLHVKPKPLHSTRQVVDCDASR